MTMTFRFFAAACPCTKGLPPIRALPSASPAVLRRKSRLLRPRCLASSCRAGDVLLNEDEAVNVNPPYGPSCSIVQLLLPLFVRSSHISCHHQNAALKVL